MTLVELLIVLVIMPMIIGAIALALVTSLQDSQGVSARLAESSDAQTTSEFFVRDVESAAQITTDPSLAQCGTGTTPLLSLSFSSGAGGTEVTYWEETTTGTPPSYELVREYCSGRSLPVPAVLSTTLISPTAVAPSITPPTLSTQAGGGWTPTAGISAVVLQGLEESTTAAGLPSGNTSYHFDLTATPRVSTSESQGVNPGGSPSGPDSPAPLLLLAGSGTALSCSGAPGSGLTVNGGIQIDSSAVGAALLSENTTVMASQLDTAPSGSVTVNSPAKLINSSNQPVTPGSATPTADPYAALTAPNPGAAPPPSFPSPGTETLYPGTYPSGAPLTIGNVVATMEPGVYVLPDGLNLAGNRSSLLQSTSSGGSSGVLLYITGGTFSVAGQASVNLAPLSGSYSAIAPDLEIWYTPTAPLDLSGNGTGYTYGGTIYAPNAFVNPSGNAGLTAGNIVSQGFTCSGNAVTTVG